MRRRAFIVLGPESSGTRLMTKLLVHAGCEGDIGDEQRFDQAFKPVSDMVVWRRSLPYGWPQRCWPDLDNILAQLITWGCQDPKVVIMVRNQYCTEMSQIRNGHVGNGRDAADNILRAMHLITSFIVDHSLAAYYFTYESLIHHPETFVMMLRENGIRTQLPPDLRDENCKYLY